MILFPVLILIAWVIIIGLNILINVPIYNFESWYVVVAVVVSTIVIIAIDGLTATIVRLLPKKWFSPFKKGYKVFKFENKLYLKLGVKKWKDLVPEIGHFTKFRKNKIADPTNNEYIERYMLEIYYGRVGHFTSMFTGFLVIFIYPLKYWTCFGLPVALVNVFMNSLSYIILRYNSPKLMAIYNHNKKMEERAAAKV